MTQQRWACHLWWCLGDSSCCASRSTLNIFNFLFVRKTRAKNDVTKKKKRGIKAPHSAPYSPLYQAALPMPQTPKGRGAPSQASYLDFPVFGFQLVALFWLLVFAFALSRGAPSHLCRSCYFPYARGRGSGAALTFSPGASSAADGAL